MQANPPVAFPTFVSPEGVTAQVYVLGRDGGVYERDAIRSESGAVYEMGRVIKNAIYGHVRHGIVLQHMGTHFERVPTQNVAIKVISKQRLQQRRGRTQENPELEMAAMQYLSVPGHENVLTQIECIQDADYYYSVMPYCAGGELFDYVAQDGPFDEHLARNYFLQILAGLEYLQQMGVVHRDMSLENLLLTDQGRVVIIDLGMCLRVAEDPVTGAFSQILPQGACGKRNYMSPEVFSSTQAFGFAADMWATGVILFIMLTGVPPVDLASELDPRYQMVQAGMLPDMLTQWGFALSPEAVDVLTRMLHPTPSRRPTIAQILQHPWIVGSQPQP